jgi:hypothetical protein
LGGCLPDLFHDDYGHRGAGRGSQGCVVYEAAPQDLEGAGGGFDLSDGGGALGGGEVAADMKQRQGVLEEDGKGGDGASNDEVEGFATGGVAAEVFGASFDDFDTGKGEAIDHVLQEAAFLAHGFEKDEIDRGPYDAQGEARKTGAGANIDDPRGVLKEAVPLQEDAVGQRLDDVASLNLLGALQGLRCEVEVP